jgi:transcriptional antiterminator
MREKLSIVGKMVGRKSISESEIYDAMILINNENEKITITKLSKELKCSVRTIHRNMGNELKKEKTLLNQQINLHS